ncbi:MAG: large conductance mechanosensitive channel protein MscL [Pseudanabaena sp. ELA645]|jgi:large conductance mechanosensitive channel
MILRNAKGVVKIFAKDFQSFVLKGNVIYLAIAVIIGGAFGKIVTSLIEDIITPLLLNPALKSANVQDLAKLQINGIKYGVFLAAVINFLVIAFVIFVMIRFLAALQRREKQAEVPIEVKPDPQERLTWLLNV